VTESHLRDFAWRQLADYDAHRPGRTFENAGFVLTVSEAYQVQRQVAARRAARGETVAGYKIGCVSEAVRRQLGLDRPAFGHVFETEIHLSGAVLDPAAFDCLAIEGEFAVRIAADILGAAWLREYPARSIASVFPVIELHNHVFRRAAPTAEELIANNALHAGAVLAALEFPLHDPAALASEPISVFRNGELLGEATGGSIPGGPLESVSQVAEHLAIVGDRLRRGQIVLTGSPLPLYPAGPGDHIVVRTARLGEVELTLGRIS
jgi:2-keto-4-pentenoate hydratase